MRPVCLRHHPCAVRPHAPTLRYRAPTDTCPIKADNSKKRFVPKLAPIGFNSMNDSIVDHLHAQNKFFITGPFGAGKTTLGLDRVRWLLSQERIRGDDITVLVPQRTWAARITRICAVPMCRRVRLCG